jgi:hypothetical protein
VDTCLHCEMSFAMWSDHTKRAKADYTIVRLNQLENRYDIVREELENRGIVKGMC